MRRQQARIDQLERGAGQQRLLSAGASSSTLRFEEIEI